MGGETDWCVRKRRQARLLRMSSRRNPYIILINCVERQIGRAIGSQADPLRHQKNHKNVWEISLWELAFNWRKVTAWDERRKPTCNPWRNDWPSPLRANLLMALLRGLRSSAHTRWSTRTHRLSRRADRPLHRRLRMQRGRIEHGHY